MLKKFLVKYFPGLGKLKRYYVALGDSVLSVRESYSQFKEDKYIWDILQEYNLKGSCYIDIGANHPTNISNTYLLYRKGFRGIIIEPNVEFVKLFRKFRKEDIVLMIGCSNEAAILPFHISKTPVISSFNQNRDINVYKTDYLPVMELDNAVRNLNIEFVNLLSIDAEGLNIEVMEGGRETIVKSLIVCVEFDSEDDKKKIADLLGGDFQFLKTFGCNMIYLNKLIANNKTKTTL